MSSLIATGTGRCGTGFFARTLAAAGLPATHEHLFSPSRPGPRPPGAVLQMSGSVYEASWLALPYISDLRPRPRVVLLWRDPVDTVRSLLGIRFFLDNAYGPDPYQRFAMEHSDVFDTPDPVDRAFRWWSEWSTRALALPPDLVVRVPLSPAAWDAVAELLPVTGGDLRDAADSLPESARNARRRAPAPSVPVPDRVARVHELLIGASRG